MPSNTSRLALAQPVVGDAVTEYRVAMTSNTATLDAAVTEFSGTISQRSLLTPYIGMMYYATDTALWYMYNGSAWSTGVLTGGYSPLTNHLLSSGSYSASPGDIVYAGPGTTVTLPTVPAGSQTIGVYAKASVSGASPVTVNCGASIIYGDGFAAASSFLLGSPQSHAVLQNVNGAWMIVSGQQDTGWVALTPGTGIVSASTEAAAARLLGDRVWLRGILQNNGSSMASGGVVASVPALCQPAYTVWLAASQSNSGTYVIQQLRIANTATSIFLNAAALPGGGDAYLDGLSYPVV